MLSFFHLSSLYFCTSAEVFSQTTWAGNGRVRVEPQAWGCGNLNSHCFFFLIIFKENNLNIWKITKWKWTIVYVCLKIYNWVPRALLYEWITCECNRCITVSCSKCCVHVRAFFCMGV
jgi:hypothetical protein